MRKMIVGLACGSMALTVAACGESSAQRSDQDGQADAVTKIKWADQYPNTHTLSIEGSQFFMNKVSELTDEKVDFDYFPGEQLGKGADNLQLVTSGAADIANIVPDYISDKMPLGTVTALPGLSDSSCQGTAMLSSVLSENGLLHEEEFQPNGVRPLFWVLVAPYDLYTRGSEVVEPSDLRGLKIRASGGAGELTLKGLGASPVSMGAPDIYTSIERGTLDGALMHATTAEAYSLPEVITNALIGASFGGVLSAWSIRESTWADLEPALQDALVEAGEATNEHLCSVIDDERSELLKQFEANDVAITDLSGAAADAWTSELSDSHTTWVASLKDRGLPASELLDSLAKAKNASQ